MTKPFVPALPSATQGVSAAIAAGVVLILAAVSWVPHLPNSLWLDETLTFWVVKDGLAESIDRGVHYQSQPAYYVFIWFWTRLAGTSEIALRIPSLLAALSACAALAKLGRLLTRDRETGLLASIVFASTWNVYRESVDARSYMLSLVVLLCLALCLLRWLDEGRWRDAWLIGALAALLPHLNVFFTLTYPAFALYAALRWPRTRYSAKQIALVGLLLLIGALLFLPAALTLVAHGGSYSFVPAPSWGALFGVFVWGPAVAGLLAGICAAGIVGSRPDGEFDSVISFSNPVSRESALLLAIWVFLPLSLLFGVSMWTETSVFLGRFLIPAIPAVSLFYAIALRGIASAPARIVAVVVIALASFATHERPRDDFRGAALAVNEFVASDASIPILFASGLIEGQDETWLRNPDLADYLNAPSAYYPLDGLVVALPRKLHGQPLSNEIMEPILREAERFAAIEWFGNGARVLPWLIQRAEGAGYRVAKRGFGGVRVAFFRFEGGERRK